MKLSVEQNDYFDTMDTLFMSKGWRLFIDDFEGFVEAMKSHLLSVKEPRDLYLAQGRIMEMQHVLNYQEMIEATKKSLEDAPEPTLETNV